jgi:3-dehydrotetronate 4-kinase
MAPLLGAIADDFTGATDLANMLVRGGMRTELWFGPQSKATVGNDADAIVVALKTRSIEAADACEQSLRALNWLVNVGASRFLFKYCSTFDSTEQGNIGPVAAALCRELDAEQTIFCPAFPEIGRTVYLGHLFVNGRLLHESGMQNHPLNPMRDADLLRVLRRQTTESVGLLPHQYTSQGCEAIAEQLDVLSTEGVKFVVCDSVDDANLCDLARAVVDWQLVTGGSGIGYWLAKNYRRTALLQRETAVPTLPRIDGYSAILAGSCSLATQRQIRSFCERYPSYALNVRSIVAGNAETGAALQWAQNNIQAGPILLYSTSPESEVQRLQDDFGQPCCAQAIEQFFGALACGLVEMGARRLIVAGGETAGAVVQALGIRGLRIGPQIDPGVPWAETIGESHLAIALKSGNFGSDHFFSKAFETMQ